jgi:hypothetical protein
MLIDIICYLMLITLLIYMTRIKTNIRISLHWRGNVLPGTILRCEPGIMNRVGLLNTPTLDCGDGLYLSGVKSIHTKGMHYPIDLIFLDDSKRILSFTRATPTNQRKIKGPKGTSSVLEMGAGSIDTCFPDIQLHSRIEVEIWKQ